MSDINYKTYFERINDYLNRSQSFYYAQKQVNKVLFDKTNLSDLEHKLIREGKIVKLRDKK